MLPRTARCFEDDSLDNLTGLFFLEFEVILDVKFHWLV